MASAASHSFPDSKSGLGGSRPYLRLAECGRILDVSTSTAYRMAHDGRLPVVRRPGGGMYVPRAALDAFIAAEAEFALENLTNGHREPTNPE